MKALSQLLLEFDGCGLTEDELKKKFEEIAKAAIYGGFFRVNDEFDIYIIDVEFYFHSENKDISTVHDWAMYHRNDKDNIVDYFPIGSLYPHNSGVDVTFEKEGKYRASFLIRQYEIDGRVYVQPSYLREDLFGYASCICGNGHPRIKWEPIKSIDKNESEKYSLKEGLRVKVGAYDDNGNRIEGKFDMRNWRFTRIK